MSKLTKMDCIEKRNIQIYFGSDFLKHLIVFDGLIGIKSGRNLLD